MANRALAISTVDPKNLHEPENLAAAVFAKCHAANQIDLTTAEINRLIKLRKAWKKRYQQCLDKMNRIALVRAFRQARAGAAKK